MSQTTDIHDPLFMYLGPCSSSSRKISPRPHALTLPPLQGALLALTVLGSSSRSPSSLLLPLSVISMAWGCHIIQG